MKRITILSVLLSVGIIIVASYSLILLPQKPAHMIDSQQLTSLTDLNWTHPFPDSKISKIMNHSVGEGGFISGIQGNFKLENNISTTLSVNLIYFQNSTDANDTYINLTNSFFESFSSHFPHNSTVSNGTIYDLMFQPSNVSSGTGSTINFTTLVAVHKNIFVEITESGISFPGSMALRILNWELKASQ